MDERPKGWDTIRNEHFYKNLRNYRDTVEAAKGFEAGADAMYKAIVEQLDEWNSLVKRGSPNYPNQCGLLLTLEKWQALRGGWSQPTEKGGQDDQ